MNIREEVYHNHVELNGDNEFVYLVTIEDYSTDDYSDAILKCLILAETIEDATNSAHEIFSDYCCYRVISVEFLGCIGVYKPLTISPSS